MEMAHHIHAIQEDLAAAVALAADERTAEAGRRLSQALGSSLQLRLLAVLSEAGREPELVYVEEESEPVTAPAGDDALTARITLRLPDSLKVQIEVAASSEGVSTNSWIVRALARGLDSRPVRSGRRLTGFADA